MNGLAELLTECDTHDIRLIPNVSGGLTIDAPNDALTPDLVARIQDHKTDILALLRSVSPLVAPQIAKPICRCGSTTWRDATIHGGKSTRRDCARCGRFLDFPVWYGINALHNE